MTSISREAYVPDFGLLGRRWQDGKLDVIFAWPDGIQITSWPQPDRRGGCGGILGSLGGGGHAYPRSDRQRQTLAQTENQLLEILYDKSRPGAWPAADVVTGHLRRAGGLCEHANHC